MADPYADFQRTPQQCASNAFAITPDDDNDLAVVASALYVGDAGDIVLTTSNGDTVTFASVSAGTILPVRVSRVFATDTTADDLVGLY